MKYKNSINYLAHMLDESTCRDSFQRKPLNESIPEIQDENNFVVIQCLFRNFLTGKQLNVSTASMPPKLRKGLDFEIYYKVNRDTMQRLLDTTLLASNCVNAPKFVNQDQIIDILSPYEPFDGFITNSYGDRITGDIMSDESTRILKQHNAQKPGYSVFRFSFFYNEYSSIYGLIPMWNSTGELVDPTYARVLNRSGNIIALKKITDNPDEPQISKDQFTVMSPFMISGYWTSFSFDQNQNSFVKNSDIRKPFIPELRAKWNSKKITMFRQMIDNPSDIDWEPFKNFLDTAIHATQNSGRDLRNKNDFHLKTGMASDEDNIVRNKVIFREKEKMFDDMMNEALNLS